MSNNNSNYCLCVHLSVFVFEILKNSMYFHTEDEKKQLLGNVRLLSEAGAGVATPTPITAEC